MGTGLCPVHAKAKTRAQTTGKRGRAEATPQSSPNFPAISGMLGMAEGAGVSYASRI